MAEIVASAKATREVTVFISLPGNEVITDEDSGDEKNLHLRNLSGNQIIADATVAAARTSAPEIKIAQLGQGKFASIC